MLTCKVCCNTLSRICLSIKRHFKGSVKTLIALMSNM